MEPGKKPKEKAADRLYRALTGLAGRVRISRRGQRDLDELRDEDAARILEDISRVATGRFPGEIKRISSLPGRPLQADAGRFRVLFRWNGSLMEVITIFPKSDQPKVFRHL